MRLTSTGAEFLIAVRRTLFEFDRAVTFAARVGRAEAGHITIGFLISLAAGRQRELISKFASRSRDVVIEFVEAGREELLERLRDRQLDLVFLPGVKNVPGLEAEPLWTERFFVVLPEEHPLARSGYVHWADLASECLLLRAYESAAEIRAFLVSKLAEDAIRLNIRQLNVSRESVINLVGMGQGIAIATDAARGANYPGIAFRPIAAEDARLPVSMVWVRQNSNPVLRTFLSFAKQRAAFWAREATS